MTIAKSSAEPEFRTLAQGTICATYVSSINKAAGILIKGFHEKDFDSIVSNLAIGDILMLP